MPWLLSSYPHQWDYDLTIRVCLEVIWAFEGFAKDSVVVDLSVDSKHNGIIMVGKGLRATLC